MNSRRTASLIVARWLATHEFPNEMLPQSGEDRAFVQDLVYTVVRRFRPLRTTLGELMATWPKGELEALVLVGAAQILYMPDVPDFAAVNETVAAAKMGDRAKRLDRVVNGVLRNLVRRRDEFTAKIAASPLAERESYPNALARRWVERYGAENAEKLAVWHNQPSETWLAYPPWREEGWGKRDEKDIGDEKAPAGFVKLARGVKVTDVEGFDDGAFIVQDPATAGAIRLLDVQPGLDVLDFCAAPGGKTVQIAWRLLKDGVPTARLIAQEVNPRRLKRLEKNLSRLHLDWVSTTTSISSPLDSPSHPLNVQPSSIQTFKHSNIQTFEHSLFPRVLVDAPCSNSGVLRRRPDARWRWDAEHLSQLVGLQAEILAAAAKYVAPGGVLVYSTCSNEPEENGNQIAAFLAAHADFEEVERYESIPYLTGFDGAFACALRRKA